MNDLIKELDEMRSLDWETEGKKKAEEIRTKYTTPEDKAVMQEYMNKVGDEIIHEMKKATEKLDKALTVKMQLKEISQIVSMKYIAENYFNKSASWLCQRINGTPVRGHVYGLKEKEVTILNDALRDIGQKLGSFTLV